MGVFAAWRMMTAGADEWIHVGASVQGKEIKQLKDLVMNLAENQYAAAAAVQRGRAEMGVPAAVRRVPSAKRKRT